MSATDQIGRSCQPKDTYRCEVLALKTREENRPDKSYDWIAKRSPPFGLNCYKRKWIADEPPEKEHINKKSNRDNGQ
jgi:hypothetical protein